MRLSARAAGIGAAIVTVLIWTGFIVIARASAAHSLTPFDIAFVRIVGASVVLLPLGAWLAWRRSPREPRGAPLKESTSAPRGRFSLSPLPWRLTALCGLFGGLLYALLAYAGFFLAPAAHGAVLLPGMLPLWTTLLAAWLLGTPVTRARAMGLALIVGGGLLVGGPGLMRAFDGGDVWKGDLLFVSAAFCWSVYSVLVRRHALDPVQATVAVTLFSFVTFVPVYGLLAASGAVPSHLGSAPWREIAFQGLFQGVGSVAISGISFTLMIRYFGPVRSTMITAVVPGLSALAAVLLLGEALSWNLLLGLVLVTVGITFGVRSTAPAPAVLPGAGPAVR